MTPVRWQASLIAELRAAVALPPRIECDGYREWDWRFGVIYTKATRNAVCAACGQRVTGDALYVIDSETGAGGWTARRRFLHLDCEARS